MADQQASNLIVGAHDSITHLLAQPSWDQWDAAVIMLSRLMEADVHVLASAVHDHLPDGHRALGDLSGARLELERSVSALHGRVHGDARLAGLELTGVQNRALNAAREYLVMRDDLARQLLEAVDAPTAERLAERWSDAVAKGATRPHPWLASRPTQGVIAFHWTRLWDRMRDTLDSRPTGEHAA